MRLVVVHNHFRPGGVRRVIELATPYLVRALRPEVTEVVLVTGEPPETAWLAAYRERLRPAVVTVHSEPDVGYVTGRAAAPNRRSRRLRLFLEGILSPRAGPVALVWAHNQGLGRNLALTRVLAEVCTAWRIPALFHHHDWWFDNRWQRWPEMRAAGFLTLAEVGSAILPSAPGFRHAAINRADAAVLRRHLGRQAGWLPNFVDRIPRPKPPRVRAARDWLARQLGSDDPVWLVPARLLRRKNIAEALVLARWLRPEAWLVTTGGVSSAGEQAYADRLGTAAAMAGWKLRLGVLAADEGGGPTVPELMAVSEVVLLTSLQEGFGLPFVEAAAANRPLIARALPNVVPDLARFGFELPYAYDELLIDPGLFAWDEECRRQHALFQRWRAGLPRDCRACIRGAWLSADGPPRPVPFSRLTLPAQLEILHQPPALSWARCLELNPFLAGWRRSAKARSLRVTRWPKEAQRLGGAAYAARVARLLGTRPARLPREAGGAAQHEFIRRTLREENLFPLTWGDRL